MPFILFLSFLISSLKGGIWIIIGILIRDHFETMISLFNRKPRPEGLISHANYEKVDSIIKKLGLLFIVIGGVIILMAFITWVTSASTLVKHHF